MNNFDAAAAVLFSLSNPSVKRLKVLWGNLSPKVILLFFFERDGEKKKKGEKRREREKRKGKNRTNELKK